jgi:hypothetical protein
LDETNATLDEGASNPDPLDRIEQMLRADDGPSDESQDSQTAQTEVEPDGGGEDHADEPQITISDLAKFLGVDEAALDLDEDGTVKFKTKIGGQEGAAKLAEVLKSYQLEGHVNKRSMELAEREKAMQAKAQEAEQQFAQRLQYAENLANVASQQLLAEFQSIDWKALEAQDPGTAALWRQKFQERQLQLRGVYDNIQQEKSVAQQKSQAAMQEAMQKEAQRLPEMIPEWKDAQVAAKEQKEIGDWAVNNGITPEEVSTIHKAAYVAVLRKAMLYDQLQKTKPQIDNKVRTAPKLVKPGQMPQNTQEQSLRNLKQSVVKSGGKNDAVERYLIATGRV